MRRPPSPPRLPARLARRLLSGHDADRLLDALDDEYVHEQALRRTRLGADLWYWSQVLRSLPPLLRRSWERRRRSDLRHTLRTLRRSPVSAGAAILTLSLTLGAGTAIVAVVDTVLLRPLSFADPGALVTLGEAEPDDPSAPPRAVGYATFRAWQGRAGGLATLEAWDPTNLTLTGRGAAERVSATDVTPGFLSLLGVAPVLGRRFSGDDAGRPVAVVSHAFWRGTLAGDPAAVGRPIVLGGRAHTVVGVLPEDLHFPLNPSDVWRPLPPVPAGAAPDDAPVRVMARLREGTSPTGLAAALDDVSRRSSPPARVVATPVAALVTGNSEGVLGLLGGAAALAMLIAFINLAGLLLVRSLDRRPELAVRRALGAPPSEPTRLVVLEAVALVGVGILGGALLAWGITPVVGRFALEFGGLAQRDLTVTGRAGAAVGILALGCAVLCGVLATRKTGGSRIVDALLRGATPSARERVMRRALVAGQIALAFVLLVSMAALGRSLLDTLSVDPGFDPGGVLKLQVSLPAASYPDRETARSFHTALLGPLRERLGPRAVSLVDELPLTGDAGRSVVRAGPTDASREAVVRAAAPDYFEVMRIPVVAGRAFGPDDRVGAPHRVVISRGLADRLSPSGSPVGRLIRVDAVEEPVEVVGVAGDVKHRSLDEPPLPTVYLSALQFPSASSILVVRSGRPDPVVVATVREEVARLDPDLPVYSVRSMRDVVAASPGVPARRLLTAAFGAFALLASALGAIGLFGLAAHDVARRRAELAVRTALGAGPLRLVGLTLRRSAWTVAAGLAVGAVLAVGAARGLEAVLVTEGRSGLFGMGLAAAALLLATGIVATLPAALRAARGDALGALRSE